MADQLSRKPTIASSTLASTNNSTKQINLKALSYLLNEAVAYAIKNTIKNKSSNDNKYQQNIPGRVDYLNDVSNVNSPSTLSYMNKLGYNVGFKIAQILLMENNESTSISNLSTSVLVDNPLEAMKFICRDVWKNLFGKQMDNLRTNHIGTFVLVDNKPIPYSNCNYYPNDLSNDLSNISIDTSNNNTPKSFASSTFIPLNSNIDDQDKNNEIDGDDPTAIRSKPYLEFNCGVIQGVLQCLGVGVGVANVNVTLQSDDDNKFDDARGVIYTVETRSSR